MKLVFKVTEVNRDFLVKYPYAALDGNITIIIKDLVFIDDGVSLLDFALSINNWLINVKNGILSDYDYSSDEYTENPVLHLTKIDDHHYEIHSAWAVNYPENILSLGEIIHCFESFLQELDTHTKQLYGITFADMNFFNNR